MYIVVKLTGITNTDLLGERPLSLVLVEFLTWVSTTTKEYSESTGNVHFPGIIFYFKSICILLMCVVLVAHNGFTFDFPILLAEMERRKDHFTTSLIHSHNIHFADTLVALRKVCHSIYKGIKHYHAILRQKKLGCVALKEVKKFGVTDLFKSFLPGQEFSGKHDVQAGTLYFSCSS